ncbi:hypothetical protein EDB89DRAFT_1561055 [Lactarius sanguifluus]|nr:hypothetical protein EDB89DRAFT_1561055 [Lactarius sanguifluus]
MTMGRPQSELGDILQGRRGKGEACGDSSGAPRRRGHLSKCLLRRRPHGGHSSLWAAATQIMMRTTHVRRRDSRRSASSSPNSTTPRSSSVPTLSGSSANADLNNILKSLPSSKEDFVAALGSHHRPYPETPPGQAAASVLYNSSNTTCTPSPGPCTTSTSARLRADSLRLRMRSSERRQVGRRSQKLPQAKLRIRLDTTGVRRGVG